jgi:RNA polymerase sigma factor (sigma-70 family)
MGDRKDEEAFAALLGRYGDFVYNVVFRTLGQPTDAEDAFQETWTEVFKSTKSYQASKGSVRSWIAGIAVHRARNLYRKKVSVLKREIRASMPEETIQPSTDLESKEVRALLEVAVRGLPEAEREVVILHYYNGLSQSEVAEALGHPVGTVKRYVHQALELLRTRLAGTGVALSAAAIVSMIEATPAYAAPTAVGLALLNQVASRATNSGGTRAPGNGRTAGGVSMRTKVLVTTATFLVVGIIILINKEKPAAHNPEYVHVENALETARGTSDNTSEVPGPNESRLFPAEEEKAEAKETASARGLTINVGGQMPIGGIDICLVNWNTGYVQYTAQSDPSGQFLISGIEPDVLFLVTTRSDTYRLQEDIQVTFRAGEESALRLPMVLTGGAAPEAPVVSEGTVQAEAAKRKCLANLKEIGVGIALFQDVYKGYPQNIEEIVVGLTGLDPRELGCPSDDSSPFANFEIAPHHVSLDLAWQKNLSGFSTGALDEVRMSYVFKGIPPSMKNPARIIVAYERDPFHGKGRNVLFADLHAEFLSEEVFQGLIKYREEIEKSFALYEQRVLEGTAPPPDFTGVWTTWWVNGEKALESELKAGVREGRLLTWHKNSQKAIEGRYQSGMLDGLWRKWHENGQIETELVFRSGKLADGTYAEWHPNGQRKCVYEIRGGDKEGRYLVWFDTGAMEVEGGYARGEKDGTWTHWYPNGQKSLEQTYKMGKQDGRSVYWMNDGAKKSESVWKDGKVNGLYAVWHENGQRKMEGQYVEGRPEGRWASWHENGLREEEGEFRNGEKEGRWVLCDEQGSIVKIEIYRSGQLVE